LHDITLPDEKFRCCCRNGGFSFKHVRFYFGTQSKSILYEIILTQYYFKIKKTSMLSKVKIKPSHNQTVAGSHFPGFT